MSCAGCTTGVAGTPGGCRSHGSCSTGGCNRMNVYDWLNNISDAGAYGEARFVEVSFKNGARKEFYKNSNKLLLDTFDVVAVEAKTGGGYDIGTVSITGELVKFQMKKKKVQENAPEMRSVIRKANDYDIRKWDESRKLEKETMIRARAISRQMELDMKIGDVEYQGDGRKVTFYYIADGRVDFRELIKVFASEFHVKIEMHQIGNRQEAGRIGGIGSCGRELCCSTWLTDFKTVVTASARYQNLSINQSKLSGQCGRLKCCLNYELDTYMDALKDFPQEVDILETQVGTMHLQKTDIFKRLMWYQYRDNNVFYPITVDRVKEIKELNKRGEKPAEAGAVKLQPVKEVLEFADVVGHTTLKTLQDQSRKKNKKKSGQGQRPQGAQTKNQGPQTQRQPNQNQGVQKPNAPNPGPRQGGSNQRRKGGPQRPPHKSGESKPPSGNPDPKSN